MSTKKILVVVESLDVNDSSATKGRVAFIESFKKIDFKVTVVHYTQKDIELSGVNCVLAKENTFNIYYYLSRLQRLLFRWFKINVSKYVDSILGFSFGFFNDVNSISKVLNNYEPNDFYMLWTFGKGTSFRTHAAVLKHPKWFKKWYAFVHDPYPQHLYPRPYNFVEYGFKKKRYFFREITINAHRMVFPSLLLKQWMQSYFMHIKDKSLIIPHQISNYIIKENKLPDYFNVSKFNLIHAGNLLNLRDPLPIVQAYENFLKNNPDAKAESMLLFFGNKSIFHQNLYEKQISIPQLYISDGYVEFDDVIAMQNKASVNLILEANSEISPFLPGKFPHCVAANKPILVIGPYYSECKRLLGNEYQYVFNFDEVDKIEIAIEMLYHKWKENSDELHLNRPDLEIYMSSRYIEEVLGLKEI